jgi:NAD(P)-dependent dehydrogenase (short-subunit alcohol dehydrogenase family)
VSRCRPTSPIRKAATRLLATVAERFGGIDVLVNNAGANKRGPIERYTPEELAGVVQVNLTAPIVLTRLVLPYLRTRGRGAIVNVASIAGASRSVTRRSIRRRSSVSAPSPSPSRRSSKAPASPSRRCRPARSTPASSWRTSKTFPDVVFAQPMSTAAEVAQLILDCAADGTVERVIRK